MFDVGFFELLLIAIIALVILGPDRLPHAARMTGAWVAKIRRTVTDVKVELTREIELQEMQQRIEQLKQQELGPLEHSLTEGHTPEASKHQKAPAPKEQQTTEPHTPHHD